MARTLSVDPFDGVPNLTGYTQPTVRPLILPAQWQDEPVPVREWIVPDLIPTRVVTMLSGDGGLGKSILALQLAVACATDDQWLGRKAHMSKVVIVACEDEPEELHRRLYSIIIAANLQFEDLLDILIIPGAGYDNVLVDFSNPDDHGKRTEFCEFVDQQAKAFGAQLIILDSLHDFFDGNENARPQARQFINHLRRIAMDIDGAVVVLAHPSVSGQSDGSGRAGSTAWNNTVRSRLYLTKPEDPDTHYMLLKTVKANYAANGGEIKIEYRGGVFYALDTTQQTDPVYIQLQVDDAFLNCLRECLASGRRVTESKYGNYAPKVFAKMKATSRNYTELDFERCMHRLYDEKRIKNGEIIDAKRRRQEGIIEITPEVPQGDLSENVSTENQL